jgi:hypothetical protein
LTPSSLAAIVTPVRWLHLSKHPIVIGALTGAITLLAGPDGQIRSADAKIANVVLEDVPLVSEKSLPLDILRGVARDYASRGDAITCKDLRRCEELHLYGKSVDLNGDGSKEQIVTDMGYTGTGAELDYIFQKDHEGRWRMIGRIDGLHLATVGPKMTHGFLDINGSITGLCVEGRGKAAWNGRSYVVHEGRVKSRTC